LNPIEIAAFRERLCDVAERLFAEKGPAAVTVRELSAELGVSSMTPYRYFADKDAMLAAVRARAFNRFAEAMECVIGAGGGDPANPAGPYIDFALDHPAAYRLMFDVNQPTFEQYPDLVTAMARSRATMSQGVRLVAGSSDLSADELDLISHMMWAAMHGPIMLEMAGLLYDGMTARRLITATLPALRRGLGTRD